MKPKNQETKIRYWKITIPDDEMSFYVEEGDTEEVESWLDGMSVGCGIKIEIIEMTDKQFNNIPQYES